MKRLHVPSLLAGIVIGMSLEALITASLQAQPAYQNACRDVFPAGIWLDRDGICGQPVRLRPEQTPYLCGDCGLWFAPAAQPAPPTIPVPTTAVTVTMTISAADALLVHAAVAPPYTAIPRDAQGQPAYTTLEGALQYQFAASVRGWVDVGTRRLIDTYAADLLALELSDRLAIEAEIKKRKPKVKP